MNGNIEKYKNDNTTTNYNDDGVTYAVMIFDTEWHKTGITQLQKRRSYQRSRMTRTLNISLRNELFLCGHVMVFTKPHFI